jgi:DNA-directed RNA polymerase specialized sigma24 family protein
MIGANDQGVRSAGGRRRLLPDRGWRLRTRRACAPWSADDVAEHLMERMPPIVNGLARRTPWAGIDRETLDELYLSAAATVSRLAASGRRADWGTIGHLERAVIAAFRNEALAYWKTVNTKKRRGDRDAAPFDPDRDAPSEDPLNRLYEPDPREELVARDWLAQLHGEVREFWEPVILEGIEYKEAGERLGVDKARRQALYRKGIEHLSRFRQLLEEGRVCELRAPAIRAYRAGAADPVTAERARAHLACCLPCALVHEAGASALKRGILHALPWAAVGRAVAWVREFPIGRATETVGAGGVVLFGKSVAAVMCAGTIAAGVCATEFGILPNPLDRDRPHQERSASPREPRSPLTAGVSAAHSVLASTDGVAASDHAPPLAPSSPVSQAPNSDGDAARPDTAGQETTTADRLDPFAAEFDFESAAARTTNDRASRTSDARRPVASASRRRPARHRHRRNARARAAARPSQQANEFDPEAQSSNGTAAGGSAGGQTGSSGGSGGAAPIASTASTGASGVTSGSSSPPASSASASGGGSSSSSTKEFVQP